MTTMARTAAPGQNGNMLRTSSASKTSTFPNEVRLSLQDSRAKGLSFESAWAATLAEVPVPENQPEWVHVLGFMKTHFRAAYEGRYGKLGRIRLEPPPEGRTSVSVAPVASQHDPGPMPWCRSSAVCTQRAISRVPGARFCQKHTEEMEWVRGRRDVDNEVARASRRARAKERAAA